MRLRTAFSVRSMLVFFVVLSIFFAVGSYALHRPWSAWGGFIKATTCLQETGDRHRASALYSKVDRYYPDSEFAFDAKELAGLLREMATEDEQWIEPYGELIDISTDARISYDVYHLRNVRCEQLCFPGSVRVLSNTSLWLDPNRFNAAIELQGIGYDAVPALLELLDDRRPTRSVGCSRPWRQSRVILRYQDVAFQILNEYIPAAERSDWAYLSTLAEGERQKVIEQFREWWSEEQRLLPHVELVDPAVLFLIHEDPQFNGGKKHCIVAEAIEITEGMVYHYLRENLEPGERIADWVDRGDKFLLP